MTYKLYQPNASDKRHRFQYRGGEKPKNYVHGLERLRRQVEKTRAAYASETEEDREVWLKKNTRFTLHKAWGETTATLKVKKLILCSGGSDGLNVACLGYDVCWPDTEAAHIDKHTWDMMSDLAENIYILFDLDSTGQEKAHAIGLQHLAIRHIVLPVEMQEHLDWRGSRIKDVREYLNHYSAWDFHQLVESALPYQFWFWTKKGPDFDSSIFYYFLNQNGFWNFIPDKNRRKLDMLISINKNIVDEVEPKDIHLSMNRFLEERNVTRQVKNAFHRTTLTEGKQMDRNLKYAAPSFINASADHQVLFFRNEAWHITASEIRRITHKEAGCCTWRKDIYDHRVTLLPNDFFTITKHIEHENNNSRSNSPDAYISSARLPLGDNNHDSGNMGVTYGIEDDGQFEMEKHMNGNGHSTPKAIEKYTIEVNPQHGFDYFQYMINTTKIHWQEEQKTVAQLREEQMHLINRLFTMGYMCHTHKNRAKAWAMLANDYWMEDKYIASGRTGKQIFFEGVSQFMRTVRLNGRDKKMMDNKHWNENVSRYTRFVWMEDCDQGFPFKTFYNYITGIGTVNPKGTQSVVIDFQDMPKFGFDSNHSNPDIDSSTKGRMLYTSFSDYYHAANPGGKFETDHAPSHEFKHTFFNDWKNDREEDWNLLANLVARCIQFHLQTGNDKLNPPMEHIESNEITASLLKNFDEWASEYFALNLNTEVVKSLAYKDYCEKHKSQCSSNTFTRSLKNWSYLRKYTMNPVDWCNDKKSRRHKATAGEHKGEDMILISDKKVELTPF